VLVRGASPGARSPVAAIVRDRIHRRDHELYVEMRGNGVRGRHERRPLPRRARRVWRGAGDRRRARRVDECRDVALAGNALAALLADRLTAPRPS
jgi:hypothetical protein